MIIIRITGGLGNQMFQYAFGKRIAALRNTMLKLDVTTFGKYKGETSRDYSLDSFNVEQQFAKPSEISAFQKEGIVSRLAQRVGFLVGSCIREYGTKFSKKYLSARNNTYLIGYWQSEDYFKEIRSDLLKEFTLKGDCSDAYFEFKEEIKNVNSVSLHIRRTDYLQKNQSNEFLQFLGLEYYIKAINYLRKNHKNMH